MYLNSKTTVLLRSYGLFFAILRFGEFCNFNIDWNHPGSKRTLSCVQFNYILYSYMKWYKYELEENVCYYYWYLISLIYLFLHVQRPNWCASIGKCAHWWNFLRKKDTICIPNGASCCTNRSRFMRPPMILSAMRILQPMAAAQRILWKRDHRNVPQAPPHKLRWNKRHCGRTKSLVVFIFVLTTRELKSWPVILEDQVLAGLLKNTLKENSAYLTCTNWHTERTGKLTVW